MDPALDDDEFVCFTEDLIKDDPTRKPFAEWRREIAEKLGY